MVPLVVLFAPVAEARRPALPSAVAVPSIEEVVQREGFVPTLSQSEIYRPGNVLVANASGGHDVVVERCIDSAPSVAVMSQSSIAATLAGGVTARLGMFRADGKADIEKRLTFVDPEQRTIPLGQLVPSAECTEQLDVAARLGALSEAVVVYDVLVAVIQSTVCTRTDLSGRAVALGAAEVSAYSECVQESPGQVPLGYKAVPLSRVVGPPTAPQEPRPQAAEPTIDAVFVDPPGLDVHGRLAEQTCARDAESAGAAARRARLDAAEHDARGRAAAAWQPLATELELCTRLPRVDRSSCIAAAEQWLSAVKTMSVSLDAGTETVQTECGERVLAFAAESRPVHPIEATQARALLERLQEADGARGPIYGPDTPGKAGLTWVDLGAFAISKTEVTVDQYLACVHDGACPPPTTPQGHKGCNANRPGRGTHPMNCVGWAEAAAFARWVGGALPTSEQWAYAASSGGQPWRAPWGTEPATCRRVVMDEDPHSTNTSGCSQRGTWPVCSKPDGHSTQGACDLAGNVAEWTNSRSGSSLYVFRGGSWGDDGRLQGLSRTFSRSPDYRSSTLGFRVSRPIR